MPTQEDEHPKKKVTAATTDAPQEEFISPENIPSQRDPDAGKKETSESKDVPSPPAQP